MKENNTLVRITTVPESLKILLKGQLAYISQFYTVIGVSSNGKDLIDVANSENITVIPVNMTRKITPIKDLISLIKLILLLNKLKPKFVHTHTPKAGLLGMLASWIIRVPYRLHTVAGLPLMEAKGLKRFFLIITERITYMCSTKIYPNSNGLYNFIIKNIYNKPICMKVIANGSSNGIDLDYFKRELINEETCDLLKNKFKLHENSFVFIFIGRLVSDKGVNELVNAFVNNCLLNKDIKLLLVGKFESDLDPLNPETKFLILNNPNIIHVGYVIDIRPYLAISKCFIFPSYREGFPNVVMQAGAMGLPSIVSNINGCNEIIENNLNGIIIEAKNIDALSKAMNEIFNNSELYHKLKSNARSMIETRYDRKKVWDSILNEYKTMENR